MKKTLPSPLSELFEQIGIEDCQRLLAEYAHLEPLARRFTDEFPRLPKRKRDAAHAGSLVAEMGLDINLFRNLLVKLYSRHHQALAKVKQAAKISEITDVSLKASEIPTNFDERKAHLIRGDVIDSDRAGGINVNTNVGVAVQHQGLPSFEQDIMQLEERMRGQLSAAQQEYVDTELVTENREQVLA